MLDFTFTSEQQTLATTLRQFATAELQPLYTHWDRTGEVPRRLWHKMADLGLFSLRLSPAYGGAQADHVTWGVAHYEIARGDFNLGYAQLIFTGMAELVERFGTPAIKRTWLPLAARGHKVICFALTEPQAGSDAAAIRTRATRDGDNYILSGEKSACSYLAIADAVVVFAKTNPTVGARGISAFLVPTDAAGVSRQIYEDMGSRSVLRGSMFLDEVRVPVDHLLGGEGEGFYQAMRGFDVYRVLLTLMCIGAADISLEETITYVKNRTAFGKPLARFEGVSFPLVEHVTRMEMLRWFCFRTLWLCDQEIPHTKEASMCKWFGPRAAVEAIHDCLQLHGHYGYTRALPFEQRLRDVMGVEFADGTAQIQKIVVARELFGRDYLPYEPVTSRPGP
jgi:cyclohexanecarboxyl-CoA dehydrogenase